MAVCLSSVLDLFMSFVILFSRSFWCICLFRSLCMYFGISCVIYLFLHLSFVGAISFVFVLLFSVWCSLVMYVARSLFL